MGMPGRNVPEEAGFSGGDGVYAQDQFTEGSTNLLKILKKEPTS